MTYFAPYIDTSGLHLPTYADIRDYMTEQMKVIYGTDIYLANDSADYQMISTFARMAFDAMQLGQLAYNNRSPVTAIGTGLDYIIKMNGLKRKVPSYSTCVVTLTGTAGRTITNGVVQDLNDYLWALPVSVVIGEAGTVDATATCTTAGAITASPGDLSKIYTPQYGWTAVTNAGIAVAGQPVEVDSQARSRQSISVATPSQTELAGTTAAIAALEGVTRYLVLENPTGSTATDPNGLGLPAHSITCAVEGSTDEFVAQAIFLNRGIGCFCNGDVDVIVTEPVYGAETTISFYRPDYVPIYVTLTIEGFTGYTTATQAAIKEAVAAYLNGLQIFEKVTISGLYGAALSVLSNLALPIFSIKSVVAGTSSGSQAATDIALTHLQVAEGDVDNITIEAP